MSLQGDVDFVLGNITYASWVHDFGIPHDLNDISHPTTIREHSEGPHRWFFIPERGYAPEIRRPCLNIMRIVRTFSTRNKEAIAIPEDWKNVDFMRVPLRPHLDYLERDGLVSYKPRSHFLNIPYPSPNVSLYEIRNPALASYSIEWLIFRVLSRRQLSLYTPSNELSPEIGFGSLLEAFCSQIRGCETIRSFPVPLPTSSAAHESTPTLNFACRPSQCSMPINCVPIVFAAQAVDRLETLKTDSHHAVLELLNVLQPTLQLLVMYMSKRYQTDKTVWRAEWDPVTPKLGREKPPLPEKFFALGINYTAVGCVVYAFFPRYSVTESGWVEWGFCCYEACEADEYLGGNARLRATVISVLLRVQRHTEELAMFFREASEIFQNKRAV